MQHWIDLSGKKQTLSKLVNGFTICYDLWILDSELEVRRESWASIERDKLTPFKIHPKKRILPIIKRNGFKGSYYGIAPHNLFSLILRDNTAETLLKAGQINLLKYYESRPEKIKAYWSSIRICIRNNYTVKDAGIFIDYMDLLQHFRKDLQNAKYVCPENLLLAHDRLVNKKRDIEKKQELKTLKERIALEQAEYERQKAKFIGLTFKDKELIVKVLESVAEFMKEGDELHHCVFTNKYYKKDNSLIFSARINNKPIETIEVSLKDLSIIQSRGAGNKVTKYHERIIGVVQKNIKHIVNRLEISEV